MPVPRKDIPYHREAHSSIGKIQKEETLKGDIIVPYPRENKNGCTGMDYASLLMCDQELRLSGETYGMINNPKHLAAQHNHQLINHSCSSPKL